MFIPTLNNPTTSKKTCPFRRTIRIFKPFPQLLHPQNDQSTTYFQKEKKRKHSYQIVYFSKISKPLYKLLSPESISIDNPSESFERKKIGFLEFLESPCTSTVYRSSVDRLNANGPARDASIPDVGQGFSR